MPHIKGIPPRSSYQSYNTTVSRVPIVYSSLSRIESYNLHYLAVRSSSSNQERYFVLYITIIRDLRVEAPLLKTQQTSIIDIATRFDKDTASRRIPTSLTAYVIHKLKSAMKIA